MKIAITARLRNGVLWDLVQKAGSQAELARILGVRPTLLGKWLNFGNVPKHLDIPRMLEVERKLAAYAGLLLEDIFPAELRAERTSRGGVRFNTKIEATREVPVSQLTSADRLLLGDAGEFARQMEENIDGETLAERVEAALKKIHPTNAMVLRERFGFEGEEKPLHVIAEEMDRSTERIRQREARALRDLRHPNRARPLKAFLR